MQKHTDKYFLAANSAEGFISSFDECYDPFDGWRAYIIKGGPGTGKSSLMRKLSLKAEEIGLSTIKCPCSSDPDSLDAVIFKDIKTVILDGTAPHIVEPKFAGSCENIINLGDCWDSKRLYSNREDIIDLTLKNKLIHKSASRFLLAAGQIFSDNIKLMSECLEDEKTRQFAFNLCKKLIPNKRNSLGKEWVRYITAITPKGIVSYSDTVSAYNTKIIIKDDFFVCAPTILEIVREYAISEGYEIITLKNPFLPTRLTDHILIPELSLCILSENSYIKFNTDERRIHSRRFLNIAAVGKNREKYRLNKKLFCELVLTACKILSRAKYVHDELEKCYITCMDFDKSEEIFNNLWKEILSSIKS